MSVLNILYLIVYSICRHVIVCAAGAVAFSKAFFTVKDVSAVPLILMNGES